jgi:hypothetical protein
LSKSRAKQRAAYSLADAHRLFGQAMPLLLAYPNVLTVGVGIRQRRQKKTGEPCFVVTVRRKHNQVRRPLPREFLGIKVDVQVAKPGRLRGGIAGAGECRAQGRTECGQIGMLCVRGGSTCALTALHVLTAERDGLSVPGSTLEGTIVNGHCFGSPFAEIGTLIDGAFNDRTDLACVRLRTDVQASDELFGTHVRLDAPVPFSTSLIGARVAFENPPGPSITGMLVEWPVSGRFQIETGTIICHNLAKLRMNNPSVPGGWSGGVLYAQGKTPLALLSYGSDASATTQTPAYAYGFPLAPWWEAWGLSPYVRTEKT